MTITPPFYFKFREGTAVRTEEIREGAVFADYDANDKLLGMEFLVPIDECIDTSSCDGENR